MATLADLFNEKSQDIYKRFAAKTEPNNQPYVSIIPDTNDSRSRIKDDNRAVSVVSTTRDISRISKFLKSSDGLLFIAKQTLLQTGNTFVDTKLYNPVSPLLNVVPFLHIRRNIPTKVLVPNPSGLLQTTTVGSISSRFTSIGQIQAYTTGRRGLLPTVNSLAKTYLTTQLKNAANTIIPLPQYYSTSRPEYAVFAYEKGGQRISDPQPLSERGIPRLNIIANIKNTVTSKLASSATRVTLSALNRAIPKSLRNVVPEITSDTLSQDQEKIPTFVNAALSFKQNFYKNNGNAFRFKSKYLTERASPSIDSDNYEENKAQKGYTGLKDEYSIAKSVSTTDANKLNYNNIIKEQERKSDIIKFIFRDAQGNNPVHFRALLSSIKESIKTEFNEQRYVGRTERFVTYGGAKRSLSLAFNVVAFSNQELDGMWSRVNYLSGLAFPKGVENGFMVPPLFKITIGGLFENQPCYVESLDYDFLDESITFDVNNEVPFAINVTMQLSILEKRSKFFDSPFYKITEEIANIQTTNI